MQRHIARGADFACKELIQVATRKWAEEEGDYRDDVRIFIICYQIVYYTFLTQHNSLLLSLLLSLLFR